MALPQSAGRGEDIIHRQAGGRGRRHTHPLVLNVVTVMEMDAHIADDFTGGLRRLERDGIQSQLIPAVSKFAPGFLVPCLLGRRAQIKTVVWPAGFPNSRYQNGNLVCHGFSSQLGVRDHWGLAQITKELAPGSCLPMGEGRPWVEDRG